MYADISDNATELEMLNTQIALANRPKPAPRSAVCLNGDCGEPSREGCNYCCSECREDHERVQWAQSQRSVV